MIIGIDGNEANVTQRVGVSVYTLQLLRYFYRIAGPENQFRVFLKRDPLQDLPKSPDNFFYDVVPNFPLWSQTILPLSLYQKKLFGRSLDLFFSPAHYIPRFSPFSSVVTIHDLSYFYYPTEFLKKDLYQLKNWTKYSVEKAKKIIAVSKTTKKDLVKWYGVPDEKVEVVYNGFEKPKTRSAPIDVGQTSKKYLLFVGTIQPRKNISLLARAFRLFKKDHPEFKLVIVGKKGWLYEKIFDEIKTLGLQESVVFTGFIPDEQIAFLYEHAFCFVLPSFYEGFGIPILEAMSYRCPVLSSFASSLPEIGGNACLYFDPNDEKDLYDKLNLLSTDDHLKQELIKKGVERIKEFSWDTCGEQTWEVLKKTTA